MARGPMAVGKPDRPTALAGTEGTRVQGESEYRCTMGRQAARPPQSTGTRPAADAGSLESTITSKIGRAHVRTPVTNAHIVCRLLLEKKKIHNRQHQINER